MHKLQLRYLVGVAALFLVLAPAAFAAGGAVKQGYAGTAGNVQGQVLGASKTQPTSRTAVKGLAGLPFTGLDLSLLVLGGLIVIAVGGTLRRASRQKA